MNRHLHVVASVEATWSGITLAEAIVPDASDVSILILSSETDTIPSGSGAPRNHERNPGHPGTLEPLGFRSSALRDPPGCHRPARSVPPVARDGRARRSAAGREDHGALPGHGRPRKWISSNAVATRSPGSFRSRGAWPDRERPAASWQPSMRPDAGSRMRNGSWSSARKGPTTRPLAPAFPSSHSGGSYGRIDWGACHGSDSRAGPKGLHKAIRSRILLSSYIGAPDGNHLDLVPRAGRDPHGRAQGA